MSETNDLKRAEKALLAAFPGLGATAEAEADMLKQLRFFEREAAGDEPHELVELLLAAEERGLGSWSEDEAYRFLAAWRSEGGALPTVRELLKKIAGAYDEGVIAHTCAKQALAMLDMSEGSTERGLIDRDLGTSSMGCLHSLRSRWEIRRQDRSTLRVRVTVDLYVESESSRGGTAEWWSPDRGWLEVASVDPFEIKIAPKRDANWKVDEKALLAVEAELLKRARWALGVK